MGQHTWKCLVNRETLRKWKVLFFNKIIYALRLWGLVPCVGCYTCSYIAGLCAEFRSNRL